MIESLTDRQKRIVASAVTVLSLVVILAAVATFFWLIALFLRAFSHVFLPLAVAGVVALVLRPYYEFLRKKARLPVPLALLGLFLSAAVPLTAFSWFFGALIVEQCEEMIRQFPEFWQKVRTQFETRWPQVIDFLGAHPVG